MGYFKRVFTAILSNRAVTSLKQCSVFRTPITPEYWNDGQLKARIFDYTSFQHALANLVVRRRHERGHCLKASVRHSAHLALSLRLNCLLTLRLQLNLGQPSKDLVILRNQRVLGVYRTMSSSNMAFTSTASLFDSGPVHTCCSIAPHPPASEQDSHAAALSPRSFGPKRCGVYLRVPKLSPPV
jgi:hypothetical protein